MPSASKIALAAFLSSLAGGLTGFGAGRKDYRDYALKELEAGNKQLTAENQRKYQNSMLEATQGRLNVSERMADYTGARTRDAVDKARREKEDAEAQQLYEKLNIMKNSNIPLTKQQDAFMKMHESTKMTGKFKPNQIGFMGVDTTQPEETQLPSEE